MPRAAGKSTHYTLAVLGPDGQPAGGSETQLPSVTHILDVVVNKPALQHWTYRKTLFAVADLLRRYGGKVPQDPDSLASLLKREKLRPVDVRDSAAKDGTAAHDFMEKLVTAGRREQNRMLKEALSSATPPALRGVALWWETERDAVDKVLAAERVLVSFKGRYAGTLDIVFRRTDGTVVLADLKTGGVYHTSFLQLAAYKLAWEESGGESIDELAILQSRRDFSGYSLHREVSGIPGLERSWRAALESYHAMPKRSKWTAEDVQTVE
jgi:hypothetical protein